MIRPHDQSTTSGGLISRIKRRQLLRVGFLAGTMLAVTELAAVFVPFFRVNKIVGLGAIVPVGAKEDILSRFAATDDTPILFTAGRFFLIHPPGAIAAAYRKCTHLGCSVPWTASEDQFHCPCHGSLFHKRTAAVVGGPAPRPLDLFHITEDPASGVLTVDTNPLNVIVRSGGDWNPEHTEVTDA